MVQTKIISFGSLEVNQIQLKTNETFNELASLISLFDDEQINIVPFEGSWTAGQLTQHLIKATSRLIRLLNGPSVETNRKPGAMLKKIRASLLDFNAKYKSADHNAPESIDYDKSVLLTALEDVKSNLDKIILSLDLTKTFTLFSFPVYGELTGLEIIYFINYHTERHIHQLKNILQKVKGK